MCPDDPEFDFGSTEDGTINAAITSAITQLAFTAWSVQPSAATRIGG